MNKKALTIILVLIFAVTMFIACNFGAEDATVENDTENTVILNEIDLSENDEDHEKSDDYVWEESEVVSIKLTGDSASSESDDISIEDSDITITAAGTYSVSGDLDDGQIIVDTDDEEIVRLVLDGVNINSLSSSAIFIKNAEKTIIVLADNTENYISDGDSYVFENSKEDEPNAAIFSKSDLTLYTPSTGILIVDGNYNDAIASKDGIVIRNANIQINAVDDGIRGKDYVVVKSGNISVEADGDGIKSDNSQGEGQGYIYIHDGVLSINTGTDAITAQKDVTIDDGTIEISSGGGSQYEAQEESSMKGIKAAVNITINGGNFVIDSADDSIHSNNNIIINGGIFDLSSGDDGMHADTSLEINYGDILISKSYEGIESAMITINDGNIDITSSDDGINVAGGNDNSALGGRPGQGMFTETGDYHLYINGGYIYMNANGDGLDSNGTIEMTGGIAIVNGPTNNGNGAVDAGSFDMTGGLLVAVGSSGMAEAPDSSSSQYSVLINFDSSQQAGTLINIQSESGEEILTFKPEKTYQSIAFSSSDLKEGETYLVYLGGSSTGTEKDGVYEGGVYEGGEEYDSFTISDITTTVGEMGMMGGGMGGGDRRMDRGDFDGEFEMPTDGQMFDGERPEPPSFME